MRRLRAWAWRVWRPVRRRARRDRDLAEEIEAHLQLHADDHERAGLTPDEARRQALLAFGGVRARSPSSTAIAAGSRSSTRPCRTCATPSRSFRKTPGFTAAVLIVLALGIGANAAIFTVVNAVLLRPLPFADPDRLVMVWHVPPPAAVSRHDAVRRVGRELPRLGARASTCSSAWRSSASARYTLTGRDEPELLRAEGVSAGFFEVLGVPPIEGRWFLPEENQPGRGHVAILSHRLWQTRFGGDRSIVGRPVLLDGTPYTVVGIMGRDVRVPRLGAGLDAARVDREGAGRARRAQPAWWSRGSRRAWTFSRRRRR